MAVMRSKQTKAAHRDGREMVVEESVEDVKQTNTHQTNTRPLIKKPKSIKESNPEKHNPKPPPHVLSKPKENTNHIPSITITCTKKNPKYTTSRLRLHSDNDEVPPPRTDTDVFALAGGGVDLLVTALDFEFGLGLGFADDGVVVLLVGETIMAKWVDGGEWRSVRWKEERKGREGKGREGKGREGKGRKGRWQGRVEVTGDVEVTEEVMRKVEGLI